MIVYTTISILAYLGLACFVIYIFFAIKQIKANDKQKGFAQLLVTYESRLQNLKKATDEIRNAVNVAFEDIDYLERLASGVNHGYGMTYYINGTTRVRRSQAARKASENVVRSLEHLTEQEKALVNARMQQFTAGEDVQPFFKMLNIGKDDNEEILLVRFEEWKWWRKAVMNQGNAQNRRKAGMSNPTRRPSHANTTPSETK